MIRYIGGKTKLAKSLLDTITSRVTVTTLIEPFCGGASFTVEARRRGLTCVPSDFNPELIDLLQAISQGWSPSYVTEESYKHLRESLPSPQRTFAGFACSYGGKWWGGYARSEGRDLVKESLARIERDKKWVRGTLFTSRSFVEVTKEELALPGACVYCDPPYAGTLGYGCEFDHVGFWSTMSEWGEKLPVFVSEFSLPAHLSQDFEVVWEQARKVKIDNKSKGQSKIERLYMKLPKPR